MICLLLLVLSYQSALNTTEFWRKELNLTEDLHFQAFAGRFNLIQVSDRSIGITRKEKQSCITNSLEPWVALSMRSLLKCHSYCG